MSRKTALLLGLLTLGVALGFYLYTQHMLSVPPSPTTTGVSSGSSYGSTSEDNYSYSYGYGQQAIDSAQITFSDTAETNTDLQVPLEDLPLVSEDLDGVTLAELQGDRNLLLVVLRGAPQCPFCTAQTSRLVSNYQKFRDLGAEVAVVFPGTKDDLRQLLTQAKLENQELPFPILVDTELAAIRRLDIEGNKAHPSTFIIDRNGRTQFAYVGASLSDRPSIPVVLAALEQIKPSETDSDSPTADESPNS